jgi:transposase
MTNEERAIALVAHINGDIDELEARKRFNHSINEIKLALERAEKRGWHKAMDTKEIK